MGDGQPPVAVPGFTGEIGGSRLLALPSRREPAARQLSHGGRDPRRPAEAAELTGRIRTYTVQGVPRRHSPTSPATCPCASRSARWLDRKADGNAAEIAPADRRGAKRTATSSACWSATRRCCASDLTPAQLIAYIRQVKQAVRVPVSTAEPWHVWLAHPELARDGRLHHHPPAALLGRPAGRQSLRFMMGTATRCRPLTPASTS